jgi:hypothetical protein
MRATGKTRYSVSKYFNRDIVYESITPTVIDESLEEAMLMFDDLMTDAMAEFEYEHIRPSSIDEDIEEAMSAFDDLLYTANTSFIRSGSLIEQVTAAVSEINVLIKEGPVEEKEPVYINGFLVEDEYERDDRITELATELSALTHALFTEEKISITFGFDEDPAHVGIIYYGENEEVAGRTFFKITKMSLPNMIRAIKNCMTESDEVNDMEEVGSDSIDNMNFAKVVGLSVHIAKIELAHEREGGRLCYQIVDAEFYEEHRDVFEELQILLKGDAEEQEHCYVNSIKKFLNIEELTAIRTMLTRNLPLKENSKIARSLGNTRIKVHNVQHGVTRITPYPQRGKFDRTIDIGLIESHYVPYFDVIGAEFGIETTKSHPQISTLRLIQELILNGRLEKIEFNDNSYSNLDKTTPPLEESHFSDSYVREYKVKVKKQNEYKNIYAADYETFCEDAPVFTAEHFACEGDTEKEKLEKQNVRDNMIKDSLEMKPLLLAAQSLYDDKMLRYEGMDANITEQMLNAMIYNNKYANGEKKRTILIGFHNAIFDIQLFLQQLRSPYILSDNRKNGTFYSMEILYKGQKFKIIDTYKMMAMPAKDFAKSFKLEGCKKGYCPYRLYTRKNIESKAVKLSECMTFIENEDDRHPFKRSLIADVDKFGHKKYLTLMKGAFHFKLMKHYVDYLDQDVKILKAAWLAMDDLMQGIISEIDAKCDALGIEYNKEHEIFVFDTLTISSLANAVYYRYGTYDNIFEVSGPLQEFILKSCKGGRTMISDNKAHVVTDRKQVDNDWNSMYPSAIYVMKMLQGRPQLITNLSFDFLDTTAGYVVEVAIRKNPNIKHLGLPLLATFENNALNYVNDWPDGGRIVLNDEQLADLIKFQHYTRDDFTLIQGCYYTEIDHRHEVSENPLNEKDKKRMNISRFGFITRIIYEMRVIYKADKNPIQQLLKLILNTAYGKNLMKSDSEVTKFVNKKTFDNICRFKSTDIKEWSMVKKGLYTVTMYQNKYNEYNRAIVGSYVLSKSKTLFYEICDYVEDWSKISYQDTDSLQGDYDEITKAVAAYNVDKNIYFGTVGVDYYNHKRLGGGHIDLPSIKITKKSSYTNEFGELVEFDEICGTVDCEYGTRAVYISKKFYMIQLMIPELPEGTSVYDDEFNYCHIRMKGCSQKSIKGVFRTKYATLPTVDRANALYLDIHANKMSVIKIEAMNISNKEKATRIAEHKIAFSEDRINIDKKATRNSYRVQTRRQ